MPARILMAAPTARGVFLETPAVAAGALTLLRKLVAAERVRVEAGSFFEAVPGAVNLYPETHYSRLA